MRKILCALAVTAIALPLPLHAEGLGTLQDLGRSMADIEKAWEKETKAFNRVKSAIDDGSIKKGLPKESIRSKYGEPVISNDDSVSKREKWVYKPSGSTFFKGIRIYLFFDVEGRLDEIRTLS